MNIIRKRNKNIDTAGRSAIDGRRSNKSRRLKLLLLIDCLLVLCIICIVIIGRMAKDINNDVPFALNGDAEMTIQLGSEFVDPGAQPDGVKTEGEVDTSAAGTYTIEYSWNGEILTRTVNVVDSEGMIIGLKGSGVQFVRQGDKYVENGAFAIDKDTGAIDSSEIEISGEVDTSTPGDYVITYAASSGAAANTATRTVRVLTPEDFGENDNEISVLMYNRVYTDSDRPSAINGNWILDTDLEEQVRFLSENGYYYPGWKELRAWIDGEIALPAKSIVVTFDGGKKDFLEHGAPLFEEYRIPVTVFMTCWEKNAPKSKIRNYASPFLDFESNSYAMHQGGHTSGYRGIIPEMTREEIADDLGKASNIVGNNDAFSYPYGDYTSDAIEAVKEQGILCAFTTYYGRITQGMDPYKLPRVRVQGDESFELWRQSVR